VIIAGTTADIQKKSYVKKLGADRVLTIGNGNNDCSMLKAARISIAVIGGEGCTGDAVMSANIIVTKICDAFNLLLNPKSCIATLRF
jgi:P-type E1-E2 ATPase